MKYDDKIRSDLGVVVCLRDMGDGVSRLFFDDVKSDQLHNPINWAYNYFYTFTPEIKNVPLDSMELTDDQYQQIGVALVARLLALEKRIK
jgi:hypothetical protein